MKNILTLSLGLLLLGTACTKQNEAEKTMSPTAASHQVIAGELVFVSKNKDAVDKVGQKYAVTTLDAEDGAYLIRSRKDGKSFAGHESSVASELESISGVEFAEPNFVKKIGAQAPRDKKWLELWALKNYGQDAPKGSEGLKNADIKAMEAWDLVKKSKDGGTVLVGIIDTGIDYTHPDLQGNIFINEAEQKGVPGQDDDGNGYVDDLYGWDFVSLANEHPFHGQLGDPDPMDDNGHGTHVSGTIAAIGTNAEGVVGINHTPELRVRLIALKFLSAAGSGSSADEYRALKYAKKMGVDVVNASYGGGGESKLAKLALKELTESGTLFVAAAGNDASDNDQTPSFPANYDLPGILSVAATDNRDQLAEFSNYGFEKVGIAAPGVNITSTYPVALAEKEKDKEPYRVFSGTSMATPHVVGAAAFVLAANPELRKKPVELKQRLTNSVDYLPQLAGIVKSGGRLNLLKAVTGEVGTSPLAQAGWVEEAYSLATAKYPTDKIDYAWKIQKPGAKAIRVHIQEAVLDKPYDLALLYDRFYRPVYNFGDMVSDVWSPAVLGDTMYLKFSNALVSVQKYLGDVEVDDPEKVAPDEYPLCWMEQGATKWTCSRYSPNSKPFANFGSESIVIDRIKYLQ